MKLFVNTIVYWGDQYMLMEVIKLWMFLSDPDMIGQYISPPDFIRPNSEHLFNIHFDKHIIYYSKFSPNEELLLMIADHYDVKCWHMWIDADCLSFGVNFYMDGKLHKFTIEDEDHLLYDICEDGRFFFEGEYHDERATVFTKIIIKKIANYNFSTSTSQI